MTRIVARRKLAGIHTKGAPSGKLGANLTYRIMEDLGVAIVTERYSRHNPLPIEAGLCEQYGVSRSVLRESVKMLTAKGLLSSRPRHGTWVQPESEWNHFDPDVMRWMLERKLSLPLLIEFTQMRLAVEPLAAGLAAMRATRAQKEFIIGAIDRMESAERGEDDPLVADIAFHIGILRASGNRFYAQLSDMIDTALRISIRMTNHFKGVDQASVPDHRNVATAILARDAVTAEAGMRAMLQETLELIVSADMRTAGALPIPPLPQPELRVPAE